MAGELVADWIMGILVRKGEGGREGGRERKGGRGRERSVIHK